MTRDLHQQIKALDDASAVALLTTLQGLQTRAHMPDAALTAVLREAWADESDQGTLSDAEAARLALEILSEDPEQAKPVERLVNGPRPERFDGVVVPIVLAGGLLLALQTRVKIQKDEDGTRWEVEKNAADGKLLAPLVKKIIDLLGG